MDPRASPVSLQFRVPSDPATTFDAVIAELGDGLARLGIRSDFAPDGQLTSEGKVVGSVHEWVPGERVEITWHPTPWASGAPALISIRFEPVPDGTLVVWDLEGWAERLDGEGPELAEWTASAILPEVFRSLTPQGFGDWLTNQRARRPSGARALRTYGDPTFHWPNFLLILDRLALRPEDRLLEVGCGGGAFLHRALESGCAAVAVDHSPAMVRLARQTNDEALRSGRLTVLQGEADALPVEEGGFTCAVMTGVFNFLDDPVSALRELNRALRPGGRLLVFGSNGALRGTPAAPEPLASRLHFCEPEEARALAEKAGLADVRVESPDLEPWARRAGLPKEAMDLFKGGKGAWLLLARRGPLTSERRSGPRPPSGAHGPRRARDASGHRRRG